MKASLPPLCILTLLVSLATTVKLMVNRYCQLLNDWHHAMTPLRSYFTDVRVNQ